MSSWIVGHTNRFKVASIGAPVVDLSHQNLTDDIEGFYRLISKRIHGMIGVNLTRIHLSVLCKM